MTCPYCGTDNPQWEHGAVLAFDVELNGQRLPAGTRICIIGMKQGDEFFHAQCGNDGGLLVCAIKPYWPDQVMILEGPWYTEEQPAERWKDVR